ncbi:MAG: hypothetical protein IKG14_06155 [Clostridia bacterium]|nr:hypothetical protein [Clostridia bacterium]
MNNNNNVITILSNNRNIVIRIKDSATNAEIKKELKDKLSQLKKFYKEEKNPILVTGKMLKTAEINDIQKIIKKAINVEVEFDSPRTLGLHGIKKQYRKEIATSETKFYKTSVRSGQKIEFEGSIIILGDVNDGAEVIAEDNIVVLGHLRGMAHAGAKGNMDAIIAAHMIDSPQIRIGTVIKERDREEIETQFYSYAYVNEEQEIEMGH